MTNLALKTSVLNSGTKQYFIASRAGIDQTRFSKIVHGHVDASPEEKTAIARALSKRIDEIFPEGSTNEVNTKTASGNCI